MTARSLLGAILARLYNSIVGRVPSRTVRGLYLRLWLGRYAPGAGVQLGCHILNGRKVSLGPRTVINFGCLLDGRVYPLVTGSDVSIGPEASILPLGHEPQSPDFAD